MRLAFAGTPDVAVPTLHALLGAGHDIAAVVTRPDAPAGRGKRLTPSPVAVQAHELGIEVLTPQRPREPSFLVRLAELSLDAIPVVAYGALLPQAALDIPRHGWINLHFSLLPRWRGAAPVQRALLAGDRTTGATTFRIVHELDAGPIYETLPVPIDPHENAGDLLARLADLGAQLMVSTLALVERGSQPFPQPDDGATYAPKLTIADGALDWRRPAADLINQVRACTPDPGAWTTLRGERLKVLAVARAEDPGSEGLLPGELKVTKNTVSVGTGTDALVLVTVQPSGRTSMPAAAWARGVRVAAGERLGG